MQKTGALAATLLRLRDAARMSQRELAESTAGLGAREAVSVGTIRAIEGEQTRPKPVTLQRLAKGLARDGFSGGVLEDRADSIYRELMVAAGYMQAPSPVTTATDSESELDRPELTDEEIDALLVRYRSDPQTYIALMRGVQDPSRLSRAAKLAIIETIEAADNDTPQRRQG